MPFKLQTLDAPETQACKVIRACLWFVLAVFCTAPALMAQNKNAVSMELTLSASSDVCTASLSIISSPGPRDDVATVHEALTALYKSTNGGQWVDNASWDTTAVPAPMGEFEQWAGLRVFEGKLVIVDLDGNNLNGTIPPELTTLNNLVWHSLGPGKAHGNQLTGSIPPELGNLTELELLNLGWSQLTGSIPPSWET